MSRIPDTTLDPNFTQGEVIDPEELNNALNVLKTGVNANYDDSVEVGEGTTAVGNSLKLDGATLSKSSVEDLQDSDVKVPTSAQVKAYIDAALGIV